MLPARSFSDFPAFYMLSLGCYFLLEELTEEQQSTDLRSVLALHVLVEVRVGLRIELISRVYGI